MKTLLSLFTLVTLTFSLHAHSVWIEDTPDGHLVVRFGEFGDELEKSPGNLDGLTQVVAFTKGADGKPTPFEVQKKADHYFLAGALSTQAVQAESGFSVLGKEGKPARKPLFYARWHQTTSGAGTPALTFDIVPTGVAGEVRVYFRGQPLPDVKVTLHAPTGPDQEIIADKEGRAHFTADKPGLYLLTCSHQRETINGFSVGLPYDAVSHNCSLTWRQP